MLASHHIPEHARSAAKRFEDFKANEPVNSVGWFWTEPNDPEPTEDTIGSKPFLFTDDPDVWPTKPKVGSKCYRFMYRIKNPDPQLDSFINFNMWFEFMLGMLADAGYDSVVYVPKTKSITWREEAFRQGMLFYPERQIEAIIPEFVVTQEMLDREEAEQKIVQNSNFVIVDTGTHTREHLVHWNLHPDLREKFQELLPKGFIEDQVTFIAGPKNGSALFAITKEDSIPLSWGTLPWEPELTKVVSTPLTAKDHIADAIRSINKAEAEFVHRRATKSRALTEEEMRELFLNKLVDIAKFWGSASQSATRQELCENVVHSVLSTIDGWSPDLPGFSLIPDSTKESRADDIYDGKDYYPEGVDISNGSLAEQFDMALRRRRRE